MFILFGKLTMLWPLLIVGLALLQPLSALDCPDVCLNRGPCISTATGFTCECKEIAYGDYCEHIQLPTFSLYQVVTADALHKVDDLFKEGPIPMTADCRYSADYGFSQPRQLHMAFFRKNETDETYQFPCVVQEYGGAKPGTVQPERGSFGCMTDFEVQKEYNMAELWGCQAVYKGQIAKSLARQVAVQFPCQRIVLTSTIPSDVVKLGSTVHLTCTTDSSNPLQEIQWRKEEAILQNNTKYDIAIVKQIGAHNAYYSISVLTFTATMEDSDAVFYCAFLDSFNPLTSDKFIVPVFRSSNETGQGKPAALLDNLNLGMSGGAVGVVVLMVILAAGMYGILRYRRQLRAQETIVQAEANAKTESNMDGNTKTESKMEGNTKTESRPKMESNTTTESRPKLESNTKTE